MEGQVEIIFLMQFQSDICNIKVSRPIITETTALGAAYLAGLAVGFWKDKEELSSSWFEGKSYSPNMEEEERKKKNFIISGKGCGKSNKKVGIKNCLKKAGLRL